jgi:teichuronic acid biosynthesis glycosyltransferase TuaC
VSFAASEVHTRKRPLRVLVVTGVYPKERAPHSGTFIKSQVDSLIAAGLEVEIIHPKPGPVAVRYFKSVLQVFFKTLAGRFDIVHGHFGLWCLVARMQWITPVVASFLGDDLLGTPIPGSGYSRKSRFVISVSRWLCHHVDGVIVKSEEMKKVIDRRVEVAVIPNGVDFALFRPLPRAEVRAALGWEKDHYYVLFGNDPLIYRKGFSLAHAALACLRERGVQTELVVANGLPQTQLVQYINACNALILPSISEGSPNIVKETMACNVPVVSADVGDVSRVIARTKGCSVCPRTPQAFAAALEQALLYTEPTTGRVDIAHLECSVVAKQVIVVYQQAITKKSAGR